MGLYHLYGDLRCFWHRARNARVDFDCQWCEFDPNHNHGLTQANSCNSHVQFVNAKSDNDLIDSVLTWKPLTVPQGSPVGKSVFSARDYRLSQTELNSSNALLHWVDEVKGDCQAGSEFLTVKEGEQKALRRSWCSCEN
jgi:hypothetical protein